MRPSLCIAASSLVNPSHPPSPLSFSHTLPIVHPLHLQQARAKNPTASPGHNTRGPDPLVHRSPSPLCLPTLDHPLFIRHLLCRPRLLHRILSSLPFSPSRIFPRHLHQQAHKVVGSLGNIRGSPLLARPRTAQEVRSNRQSRSERAVYCRCHRDSCRSRLRRFTEGSLYVSLHLFSTIA